MIEKKRRYPLALWLFAFVMTALIPAWSLLFAWQNTPSDARFLGIYPAWDSALAADALPLVYTALTAAGLSLAAGFLLGGLLVLAKRRMGIMSAATPVFLLVGGLLLLGRQLAAGLPPSLVGTLTQINESVPPAASIAIALLPLTAISMGSFALALDQNLYKAAVSLGASPAGAYLAFLFPRLFIKAVPCFVAILPCAAAMTLLDAPLPDFSADALLVTCAALLSASLILLLIIFLCTRKPRRISPC